MTLQLHDTATRAVREFTPITPGQATVYLCGATVQAPPHIGHLRSAVCFDVLTRWLEVSGYRVTFCRNVTDIEDKILRVAASEDVAPWIVAERNQRAFTWAYDAVGCRAPDIEPRATGHIPEMIALIRRLIEGGHAYPAGGDVYFDVRSYPAYGALSGQRPDQMRPTEEDAAKRDPLDFTLWKGAKQGEPFWETPWGPGRPGWHLECSAMATKYLGSSFDIHCGGLDLVFPHHENEIAQSRAAGDGFARYWLHNGLLGMDGEKMSKSLGNSLLVSDVLTRVRPAELRYYLVQAHYRSLLEFSEDALEEAVAAYQRIERFVRRATETLGRLAWTTTARTPASMPGRGTVFRSGCLCRSARPWTRISPFRRRWPRCTPACGTATRPWPRRTRPGRAPACSGCAPCWTCSGWTRSRRTGPGRQGRMTGSARSSAHWSS